MDPVILTCAVHGDVAAKVLTGPWPGGHWAKAVCPQCDRWLRWLPKPNGDSTRYRRPASHKELVAKYGNGFCEMCLRDLKDIPLPQVLEGHHVVEFQDGGSDDRSNVWIVCTACHKLIHYQRTYLGHFKNLFKRPDDERN